MIAELFAPKSHGAVTLKSADPVENPVVYCNYLADPLDVSVLGEACRFGNEIVMKRPGTKGIVKESWPPHLSRLARYLQDEGGWVPYVRACYFVSSDA